MHFHCNTSDLLKPVSTVHSVVSKRPQFPLVEQIKIAAQENQVAFYATNFIQSIRYTMEADIQEEGEVIVPGEMLYCLVKELPEGEVHLKTKKNHRLVITCNQNEYRLSGMSTDDYPAFTPPVDGVEFVLSLEAISDSVKKNLFCIRQDSSQPVLNGIQVRQDGEQLIFTSTDRHRLSQIKINSTPEEPLQYPVVIPTQAWKIIHRYAPESPVFMRVGMNNVMFSSENLTLLSGLLAYQFPETKNIIPLAFKNQITLQRKDFLQLTERSKIFGQRMRLSIAQNEMTMEIQCDAPYSGDAREVLPVQYEGEPIQIILSCDYVRDFLNSITEEFCILHINESTTAIGFSAQGANHYLHLIMPMSAGG